MAKTTKSKKKTRRGSATSGLMAGMTAPFRLVLKWLGRAALVLVEIYLALIVVYKFVNPPTDYYMWTERHRLGAVDQQWVAMEDIAPVMARSVVAAEDANFCNHWGFDMHAIREAIDDGANRGASTISQQVVKNVFLWQGRSWIRKAMEAALTRHREVAEQHQREALRGQQEALTSGMAAMASQSSPIRTSSDSPSPSRSPNRRRCHPPWRPEQPHPLH